MSLDFCGIQLIGSALMQGNCHVSVEPYTRLHKPKIKWKYVMEISSDPLAMHLSLNLHLISLVAKLNVSFSGKEGMSPEHSLRIDAAVMFLPYF